MTPYQFLIHLLESNSNFEYSVAQKAYLKHQFEFYGITSPIRKTITKELKQTYFLKEIDHVFIGLIKQLWQDDHRECQHVAIELMQSNAKKFDLSHLPFFEFLITHKSWWDSVDGIAPHLVGTVLMQHEDATSRWISKWMDSDNIWLQRSAIIFQLKYGKKTDWDLLCEAILRHDRSTEFFVRKAQGWALRQYSKYEPKKVLDFVESNPQLSGLTKREAIRNIT